MDRIYKRAVVGGVVSTLIMGLGTFILGQLSGYKAKELLSGSLQGINMLCNTVILGSATILALMLTVLSVSRSSESRLTHTHYKEVLTIAKSDTILIICSIIFFLLLNLPITQSPEVPYGWYTSIYYLSLAMASLVGGGFIAVVTMLYGTISNIIRIVGLNITDHPLVDQEDLKKHKEEIERKEKEIENNTK